VSSGLVGDNRHAGGEVTEAAAQSAPVELVDRLTPGEVSTVISALLSGTPRTVSPNSPEEKDQFMMD